MVFEYQKYGRYFAQCAHGMEELAAGELVELGARNPKPDYRGVYFETIWIAELIDIVGLVERYQQSLG